MAGGSYELRHCHKHNTIDKKKATHLSPYLLKLFSMPPLDGCDTSFGDSNKHVVDNPHYEAGM